MFTWLWVLAVVVAVPVGFAVARPRLRERYLVAARRTAAVRERAEEQHRWVLRGDDRGVYGPDGARLMASVADKPRPDLPHPADEPIAAITDTEQGLAQLLRDRHTAWHWAAFGTVLVLRRDAVSARLQDHLLHYTPRDRVRFTDEQDVVDTLYRWAQELCDLVGQVQQVMLSRGFQAIFADSFDETAGSADPVLQTANRLMDVHDRFLELSEDSRALAVPSSCTAVVSDFVCLVDIPLRGFQDFIDDYVARIGEIPEILRYARGPVAVDPVLLDLDGDDGNDAILDRFFARLREIDRG